MIIDDELTQQLEQLQAENQKLKEQLDKQIEVNDRFQRFVQETRPIAPDNAYADSLEKKIEELSLQLDQAQAHSTDDFIKRVSAAEAMLVAFHPGAGHLTIPPNKMLQYSDNPVAYAAEKCAVAEDIYAAWLEHYKHPICRRCGRDIEVVEQPQEFQKGIGDACNLHRELNG